MYNIKQIVDKIIKESDVNPLDYPVSDRIDDVNEFYLEYIEQAVQIGSTVPISEAEDTSEDFTVVAGSNTFTRTIQDVPILRVDFQNNSVGSFEPVCEDPSRLIGGVNIGKTRYFANEKQIFVEEGYAGTLRVTYARGGLTLFTEADYNLGSGWPSPDYLPNTFQPLLWLRPALRMAELYKPKRVKSLRTRVERLETLFYNHYGRESAFDLDIVTDEGSNNR